MVKAILEGRKTQTRRVVKPQPINGLLFSEGFGYWFESRREIDGHIYKYNCPYGQVGDKLWVRETWAVFQLETEGRHKEFPNILYRADSSTKLLVNEVVWKYNTPELKWRPSIFMPRWASRITLEITDIRVQRLWEITDEDVIAEGIGVLVFNDSYKDSYAWLWDKINGKKHPWILNEWVWVISFKRV
jgi:hypothetical protein